MSAWSSSIVPVVLQDEDNDFAAISTSVTELLKAILVKDQEEIDRRLQERFNTSKPLSQAVSYAAATGSALLSKIPLHKHITSQEV